MPAMTAMPAHADAHALLPVRYVCPDRIDDAHDLVARNPRVLDAGKSAGDGKHVAMADSAGLYFDADLARLGIGYVPLDHLEIGVGLGYLSGLHSLHVGVLRWIRLNANATML